MMEGHLMQGAFMSATVTQVGKAHYGLLIGSLLGFCLLALLKSYSAVAQDDSTPALTQADKVVFLASVDTSITAEMIFGNMFRYNGKRVDLHCTIANIPAEDFFGAECGSDAVPIEIVHNTKSLSVGQKVRVIGFVEKPMDGTNALGGERQSPEVSAVFIE
jgi:hypothetical protein